MPNTNTNVDKSVYCCICAVSIESAPHNTKSNQRFDFGGPYKQIFLFVTSFRVEWLACI